MTNAVADKPLDRPARRAGWRLILRMMAARPGWLLTGVVAALAWTAARLVIPLLTAAAVNEGILKHDTPKSVRFAVLIAIAGVVQMVGTGLRRYGAFWLAYRTE